MKKNKLRKIYLTKQKSLSNAERRERSLHINGKLFENFDLDDIRYLHLFLSIREKNEVDTSVIINDLWSDYINIKTIVPRVDFEKDMLEHLEFNSEGKLKLSSWGIPEPVGDKLIDERKIDLVLVPLLVFDKRGYRVGYGKGFYDKFLSKCRPDCRKVGLSFFEPVEEIEDIHEYDVKLDFCITPEKIWNFLERPPAKFVKKEKG
jgi:5-formyltetrahydrofolate cyclo-ligase